jgi:hypothetical protein
MNNLKAIFITKLELIIQRTNNIEKQANYLLLAKHGLAAASRLNNTKEIEIILILSRNI